MLNENNHSVLATSLKEWVHCAYSTKFLATKEEETNDASEFGTECHVLAEAYIKQSLKIKDFDERTVSIDELKSSFKHYDEEMEGLKEIVVPSNNTCWGVFSKEFWNETSKLCWLGFLKSKICLLQSRNIVYLIKNVV